METKELQWFTYNQWQDKEMQVQRGQKATWIDGIPKFSSEQVRPENDFYPEAATDWDWYK